MAFWAKKQGDWFALFRFVSYTDNASVAPASTKPSTASSRGRMAK